MLLRPRNVADELSECATSGPVDACVIDAAVSNVVLGRLLSVAGESLVSPWDSLGTH